MRQAGRFHPIPDRRCRGARDLLSDDCPRQRVKTGGERSVRWRSIRLKRPRDIIIKPGQCLQRPAIAMAVIDKQLLIHVTHERKYIVQYKRDQGFARILVLRSPICEVTRFAKNCLDVIFTVTTR